MAVWAKLLLAAVAYAALLVLTETTTVYTYCDLTRGDPGLDPSVITSEMATQRRLGSPPRGRIQAALQRSSGRGAREFIEGVKRTQQSSSRAAQRAALRSASKNGPGKKFIAPMERETLCDQREVQIIAAINNGDICWVIDPQVLTYSACKSQLCKVANPFGYFHQFHCMEGTFVYTSALTFCPDTAEVFRYHTFYVPVACHCRHLKCDLNKKIA